MCMGHCHLFSLFSGSGLIRDIVGVNGLLVLFSSFEIMGL
jgi:hypothetical protein